MKTRRIICLALSIALMLACSTQTFAASEGAIAEYTIIDYPLTNIITGETQVIDANTYADWLEYVRTWFDVYENEQIVIQEVAPLKGVSGSVEHLGINLLHNNAPGNVTLRLSDAVVREYGPESQIPFSDYDDMYYIGVLTYLGIKDGVVIDYEREENKGPVEDFYTALISQPQPASLSAPEPIDIAAVTQDLKNRKAEIQSLPQTVDVNSLDLSIFPDWVTPEVFASGIKPASEGEAQSANAPGINPKFVVPGQYNPLPTSGYQFTSGKPKGTNCVINCMAQTMDWLRYAGHITSPASFAQAEWQEIQLKEQFYDTMIFLGYSPDAIVNMQSLSDAETIVRTWMDRNSVRPHLYIETVNFHSTSSPTAGLNYLASWIQYNMRPVMLVILNNPGVLPGYQGTAHACIGLGYNLAQSTVHVDTALKEGRKDISTNDIFTASYPFSTF